MTQHVRRESGVIVDVANVFRVPDIRTFAPHSTTPRIHCPVRGTNTAWTHPPIPFKDYGNRAYFIGRRLIILFASSIIDRIAVMGLAFTTRNQLRSLPMELRKILAAVLPAVTIGAVFAATPAQDSRNTRTPNTDTHFAVPRSNSLDEWTKRAEVLRRQVRFAAGLLPMPEKTPLNAQIFGRIENRDYSIEKVYIETLPGFFLAGNLYRPLGKTGKFPGMLAPHGHAAYGRLEHGELFSVPSRGINHARQGYVVFAYDMIGYNDTMQIPHAFGGPREQLWGFTPLGLQTWNSIRALDFLQTLPDVDPEKIVVTGESGGGTQTFLLCAVDDRPKWSAPVNMISLIMQGGSPCENAPGLRVDANNVEIASLMAPKPMLMVSATGDWTRNTPKEEFPAIKAIYDLYGKGSEVETIQIDAPHNYNKASREAVYRFMAKKVLNDPDASKYSESRIRQEKLQDMMVFSVGVSHPMPSRMTSSSTIGSGPRKSRTIQPSTRTNYGKD